MGREAISSPYLGAMGRGLSQCVRYASINSNLSLVEYTFPPFSNLTSGQDGRQVTVCDRWSPSAETRTAEFAWCIAIIFQMFCIRSR